MPRNLIALAVDLIIVGLLISVISCWVYRDELTNGYPIVYDHDGLVVLSRLKAYQQGETSLVLPQYVSRFNAPFSASWSDYPSDKVTFYVAGLLSRSLGIANGSTLGVVLVQVVCGLCFLASTRLMGFMRMPSVVCSVLFGLAPYAFARNLNHLNLLFYGLLPLQTVMLLRLMRHDPKIVKRLEWGILIGISLVAGLFNVYYLFWYLGFLLLLTVSNVAVKKWDFAMLGAAGLVAGISGLIIQNLDTFLMRHQFGLNSVAVCRSYDDLGKYGLTLPDLFFPGSHGWPLLESLSRNLYISKIPNFFYGESQMAYIGMMAAVAFVWMMGEGLFRILSERAEKVSPFFWISSGVLALGLVGGVNYLIGAFGFYLLRGTNRFSIVLAGISLLFLCAKLSSSRLGRWMIPLTLLILLLGVGDQLPAHLSKSSEEHKAAVSNYFKDGEIFKRMEQDLPSGGMVFQLPVHFFPEHGAVNDMGDYEHFRPYLQTDRLRFSYGTIKGRDDTWWQYAIEKMSPKEMISELERLGFSALLINRKAYNDHAADFVKKMAIAGFSPWLNEGDFIAYRLKPAVNPVLPEINSFHMVFSGGFYQEEKADGNGMRWCGKSGEIRVIPCALISNEKKLIKGSKSANFGVTVAPANPQVKVFARINGGKEKLIVAPGEGRKAINFSVPPEGGGVRFRAEGPAAKFPGDPRDDVRFRIIEPSIDCKNP